MLRQWHPTRQQLREAEERVGRFLVTDEDGREFTVHTRLDGALEAAGTGQLVLDRRTGHYHDPATGARVGPGAERKAT